MDVNLFATRLKVLGKRHPVRIIVIAIAKWPLKVSCIPMYLHSFG
jgi:hypothetical protein